MKKKIRHFASFLLGALLFLPLGRAEAATATVPDTIRVGVAQGGGALPGANLLNSVGSGYRLGYFDSGLSFVQLGYTYETAISVLKTQTLYFDGKNYVPSASGAAVGCYHLQLPGAYGTYDDALRAAGQVGGFPAWIDGAYYVRQGAYLSAEAADQALATGILPGGNVVGTSGGGVSVVKTGTAHILFQFDSGGAGGMLGIQPDLSGAEKPATWFAGYKYYGGFRYQRIGGGDLTVVNILDREDYINCVISQEMSEGWPLEALKAQSVVARSYAAVSATRHKSQGFDLCNTTHCQAYPGMGRIGVNTARAAAETAGQYVWYGGDIVETYYFSSDGGATEDAKNVWTTGKPYLVGVIDPWEAAVADKIPNYNWSITYTTAELEQKLRAGNRPIGDLAGVVVNPTPTGNAKSVTFTDTAGKSWTIAGDSARIFIKPNNGSVRYRLESSGGGGYFVNGSGNTLSSTAGAYAIGGDGGITQVGEGAYAITSAGVQALRPAASGGSGGSYTFVGSGWGHNVGMSQWGAYAMAQAGKTYDEILKFYYTGVEVK